MTTGASALSCGAGAGRAVLLLAVGYLLVGYATLSPGHAWGDDWAQYVNHARNLALGRAYSATGYVFNPSEPHIGPPAYSPGFPYAYLRDNTADGALIAFIKPRVIALLTGRRAWVRTAGQDRDSNWRELARVHADYVVLVSPAHPLAARCPAYLSWDTWRSNPRLALVYENQTFRVLRLKLQDS